MYIRVYQESIVLNAHSIPPSLSIAPAETDVFEYGGEDRKERERVEHGGVVDPRINSSRPPSSSSSLFHRADKHERDSRSEAPRKKRVGVVNVSEE